MKNLGGERLLSSVSQEKLVTVQEFLTSINFFPKYTHSVFFLKKRILCQV